MDKLLLIDGNSILNRAFYGIMGTNMLKTADGTYTNAVYGFLAILFKILEDLEPEYIAVAFDLKAPTARHKLYEEYKATRKGMPNELAEQMPIIKEVLHAMNITMIEKEGYEADDILGTLAKRGEREGLEVTILSGDRDTFQLVSDKITVRIPRTKGGKTETEDFNRKKVLEVYGLEPEKLIEVKGLMGDTSDNIPGIPGVGEKTALALIKEYSTIQELYQQLENETITIKGKLKEKIEQNKELAFLSRTLGIINTEVPIVETMEEFRKKEWNRQEVLKLFEQLRFNRYIQRFGLKGEERTPKDLKDTIQIVEPSQEQIEELVKQIEDTKQMTYYLHIVTTEKSILHKKIEAVAVYYKGNLIYYIKGIDRIQKYLKKVFEDVTIEKQGYKQKTDDILLREQGIILENATYDAEVVAYLLDPTKTKYTLEEMSMEFLEFSIEEYLKSVCGKTVQESNQMTLFETEESKYDIEKYTVSIYAYMIHELKGKMIKKIEATNQLTLLKEIEMPTSKVLADMQYQGIYLNLEELIQYGNELKQRIEELTKEITSLAGQDFNINSPKQLGEVLFERLELPVQKKTKSGYSTDVEVLEKLRQEHPIIEKILEYRQMVKLNSTYVEGMIPYVNQTTNRIHSYFHQTVTATGRISSTEPNLQNIPTRFELGKKLRAVFKPAPGYVYIDADYSQIELRLLAHISKDETMIEAFKHNADIHAWTASKVFNIPLEEVTKEKRSEAKAVNFGIVYGISEFGLAEQLGISRKQAKTYIDQYLERYHGIRDFMNQIIEQAKKQGYVETIFHRRRYIPELNSNNYMVRQFGARAAMNAPIQGTAADIMKIAMIHVWKELRQNGMKSKIILQIHDELLIEAAKEEKEEVKRILKTAMETAVSLDVPLIAELSEANNWYEAK